MTEQETRCSDTLSRALDKCQSSVGKAREGSRLRTGTFLDELTGGLKRGDLTVLVGKTGAGKSALARNLAMNISASEAEHVLLAPLQDASEEAAILRLAAIEGGVPLAVLDQERMSKADRIDVLDAIDGIRGHNIDIVFRDGLSLTPMLFEWAMGSFDEDLSNREVYGKGSKNLGDDVLPGSGAVIVDTMTLLSLSRCIFKPYIECLWMQCRFWRAGLPTCRVRALLLVEESGNLPHPGEAADKLDEGGRAPFLGSLLGGSGPGCGSRSPPADRKETA